MSKKKIRPRCPVCGREPERSYYKYCSNACQGVYQRARYIEEWKAGKRSGLNNIGLVTKPIKNYLREKFKNKCSLCGWAQVNPKTGLVPLVADHIDGNWRNNTEENLRLICPNCDSLNPTYAGSNKGRSGRSRPLNKRAAEARNVARA